jgi:glutamine synthetase
MTLTRAEYIWVGGNNELRSKTKILDKFVEKIDDLPIWNYDGSSTEQASGEHSEVLIKPRKIYKDFDYLSTKLANINTIYVVCDTWLPDGTPHKTNTRIIADKIFSNKPELEPWFGMEQEFFVIDLHTNKPIGFPEKGYPEAQGPYYCSVGGGNAFGRQFFELVELSCLKTGINLTGKNFEVCCGQMELQVRNVGIDCADDMMMMKYILNKTAELFNYKIDFSAKPIKGDWNGSGCHTNFSTKPMREEGGYALILEAIDKLSKKHKEHIEIYGDDNNERLTGLHETANIDEFSYGVGNRGASIRIPTDTEKNGCGYFEDRRPSSSCDPYLVTSKLYETCCL